MIVTLWRIILSLPKLVRLHVMHRVKSEPCFLLTRRAIGSLPIIIHGVQRKYASEIHRPAACSTIGARKNSVVTR